MIYPVVLCGGSGTRLWPLSRKTYPKQFLDLLGSGDSLLQATVKRLGDFDGVSAPIVVCNAENRFLVAQQLLDIGVEASAILLEPVGRNTAPAIACAAWYIQQRDPDARLVVLPSDHVIADVKTFHDALATALSAAEQGSLVTFGIAPTHAETGYGYIKKRAHDSASPSFEAKSAEIERFVEKPDAKTAETYLTEGRLPLEQRYVCVYCGGLSRLSRCAAAGDAQTLSRSCHKGTT